MMIWTLKKRMKRKTTKKWMRMTAKDRIASHESDQKRGNPLLVFLKDAHSGDISQKLPAVGGTLDLSCQILAGLVEILMDSVLPIIACRNVIYDAIHHYIRWISIFTIVERKFFGSEDTRLRFKCIS